MTKLAPFPLIGLPGERYVTRKDLPPYGQGHWLDHYWAQPVPGLHVLVWWDTDATFGGGEGYMITVTKLDPWPTDGRHKDLYDVHHAKDALTASFIIHHLVTLEVTNEARTDSANGEAREALERDTGRSSVELPRL